jgi:hypothetical protein
MVFQPIEAFSVGRWQDASGTIHDFPAEVVSQVAETYDTSRHRAAIVTNHSEQGPAKGFVKTLKFIDSKLFAEPENIEEGFRGEVDAGRWPNVSIRLYPPLHPNNPSPGKWSLRHLSYVVTGAVKGLATPALVEQAPAFAENEDGFVDLFLAFEDSTEASSAASESLAEAKTDTDETPADDAPEAPADVGAEDVSEAGIPISVEPPIESSIESVADSNDESLEHSDEAIESIQELPPDDSPGDPPPNKETPMTIDEEKKVEAPGVVEPSDSDRQLLAEFAEAQASLAAEREKLEADKAEVAKFKTESLERTRKAEERLRIANAEIEAQKASLAAQKVAAAKEREDSAFCDQLSKDGKLTGEDDYAQVMAILKGPSLDKEVCFSDDEKDYTYPELLKDFLTRSLPVKVDFAEKSAGNNDSAQSGPMSARQIAQAARKMVADAKAVGNDISYEEAVNKISGGM